MKNICLFFLVLSFLFSCKKENTNNNTQHKRLCDNYNNEYYYTNGTDTAICFVPNAFTPNGDGVNDLFLVWGKHIQTIHTIITDSSGIIIHLDSLNAKWDGVYNSNTAPENLYYVTVTGIDNYGHSFTINGTVSLIYYAVWWPPVTYHHPYTINCDSCALASQWDGDRFFSGYPQNESFTTDTSGIICN